MMHAFALTLHLDPMLPGGPGVKVAGVVRLPGLDRLDRAFTCAAFTLENADDASAPVVSLAVWEWMVEHLAPLHTGPVEPLDVNDPAYPAVLRAATEEISTGQRRTGPARGGPLSVFDPRPVAFAHAVERVVRSWALPTDTAYDLLAPQSPHDTETTREMIDDAIAGGFARARTACDVVLADLAYVAKSQRLAEEAHARAARAAAEKKPRHGLLRLRRTLPIDPGAHTQLEMEIGAGGLIPMGDSYVFLRGLPGWTGELVFGLEVATGTFALTDAEASNVGPLGDGIALRIAQRRRAANTRAYSDKDFHPGDARTVDGRHALSLLRFHVPQLVAIMTEPLKGAMGGFASDALLTLPVAFGGRVNLVNACDAIADAINAFNARRGAVCPSLPTADAVPREMVRALAAGSVWAWGELYREPTEDEQRQLTRELDPSLISRVIATFVANKPEVKTQEVYAALYEAKAVDSLTPSAPTRTMITRSLESLGLINVEVGTHREKNRRRVWLKPASAPESKTAPTDVATAPVVPVATVPVAAPPVVPTQSWDGLYHHGTTAESRVA